MSYTNFQFNPEVITPVDDLQYTPLGGKYRTAYMVATSLVYLVLMAAALLLLCLDSVWYCVAVEILLAAAFIINMVILPKAVVYKGYAFREHDLSYRSGIIFPKTITVPYRKVQQVSVKQNPVTKFFGLYTVGIANGAQNMSMISIPGLTRETAEMIKAWLTDKLRNGHD